jgi:hypothetical protein
MVTEFAYNTVSCLNGVMASILDAHTIVAVHGAASIPKLPFFGAVNLFHSAYTEDDYNFHLTDKCYEWGACFCSSYMLLKGFPYIAGDILVREALLHSQISTHLHDYFHHNSSLINETILTE